MTSLGKWIEPWYAAYALLGAAAAGLAPILLPLAVSRSGNAATIGLVMAAVSLGGLAAPVWGGLADRRRLHRGLLVGGLLATAAAAAAFAFATGAAAWVSLGLLLGAGAAAAATVANLFVVERHPAAEWDQRLGWLQLSYGGGQVGGLLLAGVLGPIDPRAGLLVAAGLLALGVLPAWANARTPSGPASPRPVLAQPARHGEWAIGSPQRLFHYPSWSALRRQAAALRSPFSRFLLAWLLSFAGAAVVFSLYPVLMQQGYGVAPGLSSLGFAAAAGLGLALYSPAGRWSARFGAARLLRAGLGVRLVAFLALVGLALVDVSGRGWLAWLSFLLVVLAWSLLSVTGTALAARLSPVGEGEGLGVFNAATALAGTGGAALGGWVAGQWGYAAAAGLAAAGVALGLALMPAIRNNEEEPA